VTACPCDAVHRFPDVRPLSEHLQQSHLIPPGRAWMLATALVSGRQLSPADLGRDGLIKIQKAAKLGGVHPAILEMGQRLLKSPGAEGGVLTLGTPDLKERAEDIRSAFVKGLRKVGGAMGDGLAVKSHRDGDRLVFWYAKAAKAKA